VRLGPVAVALYAGSFDPIHLGHLGVVQQATRAYDEVVVAVVANPQKATGMFTPEERVQLVNDATAHLSRVRSTHFYGLTVDLARREGATVLLRAAHKEQSSELSMAATNRLIAGIPTILVHADPRTRAISSSLVRQLITAGKLTAAQQLVPPCVARALAEVQPRM
jgi:pantetheine-phosphate adenylyltransferase